jgi:formylglycine-generating enzyme required for sulfatase activity
MKSHRILTAVLAAQVLGSLQITQAQGPVVIETVTVGNPGNVGDDMGQGLVFGAVGYVYSIARYEVTAAQYTAFLNAVAASDDYGLYNPKMDPDAFPTWNGCNIKRHGAPGSYTYSVAQDWANRPVNFVSWGDAARFSNWLHNGQPSGTTDLTTTEDGSYFLNGMASDEELEPVVRKPGATWVIPTENEWYKAAYHRNDGPTGNYWNFPTRAMNGVSNDLIDPDPGNNATFQASGYTIGAPYFRTDVGAHENSVSAYGTFDQEGNVMEFNETVPEWQIRGIRGNSWFSGFGGKWSRPLDMHSGDEFRDLGFRVASLAGGPVCGNQICEAGESPATCADCACVTNGDCSDGLFCNGAESCSGGVCQAGTPVACGDPFSCTTDSCNEATDSCTNTPVHSACDNGLFCDGVETCNATFGCLDGPDPCSGACHESTDTCAGGPKLWMSFKDTTTVPGVGNVEDEDIVAYDTVSGTWTLQLDGSDVGLSGLEIGGMAVLPNGDILLSFTTAGTVPGLVGGPSGTSVDDSDIVRFTPTSLGATTSGTFAFHFDGSDVGMSATSEGIDGIALSQNGSLVLSTTGTFSASGASGAGEDLFTFAASTLGANTTGTFSILFDGSDVGLSGSSENIDAVTRTAAGQYLLSTTGSFAVPGVSGANEDVLRFAPSTLGAMTSGSYSMFLDLSTVGISSSEDLGSLFLVE